MTLASRTRHPAADESPLPRPGEGMNRGREGGNGANSKTTPTSYRTIRMERRNGILVYDAAHRWRLAALGFLPHGECPTRSTMSAPTAKTGWSSSPAPAPSFPGPRANPGTSSFPSRPSIEPYPDRIHWEGRHLLMKLLEIEVPVISRDHRPAWRHSEIPLLCDIVLAAGYPRNSRIRRTSLRRGAGRRHAHRLPAALGHEPGPLFLLTGQTLNAPEGARTGPRAESAADKLLARAWELAETLPQRPCCLRYTRLC